MRVISVILFLQISLYAFGQNSADKPFVDSFTPLTLTAGTAMSARTVATTLSDTTRGFTSRGYAAIYVALETAANDSASPVIVSYAWSKDGSTYSPYSVVDSLNATGTVGLAKYIPLPSNALGAYSVRVRVYGRAGGDYSAGPVATVTTKILRILNTAVKVK